MKNLSLISVLIMSAIFMTSCDDAYMVEYIIVNDSNYQVEVKYKILGEDIESNGEIASITELRIFDETGIGNVKSVLESINSLPFDYLEIKTTDGLDYNRDELTFGNWSKHIDSNDESLIQVTLRMNNQSF